MMMFWTKSYSLTSWFTWEQTNLSLSLSYFIPPLSLSFFHLMASSKITWDSMDESQWERRGRETWRWRGREKSEGSILLVLLIIILLSFALAHHHHNHQPQNLRQKIFGAAKGTDSEKERGREREKKSRQKRCPEKWGSESERWVSCTFLIDFVTR